MTKEGQLFNREDIIRMAREAHHELVTQDYPGHLGQLDPWTMRLLERFAALVSKQERGLGFNQGYKQAIKDCVVLLMIQHEMANGAHNYWHVAANLIQAEYGVQHDD